MPPNATTAEITEFYATMDFISDNIAASTPEPQPEDFGGRCEDAPCCGCCGNDRFDSFNEYEREQREADEESDELRAREEDDHYADMCEREEYARMDAEDRYLDSYWEDQSEYGMEGCCGDF